MNAILDVSGLKVEIPLAEGMLHPVRGIDFSLERGKTLCIVGESGCGKSLTSLAVMGLLPQRARRSASRIVFDGTNLQNLSENEMSKLRGSRLSMVFQDPMTSLNPSYTIGDQLTEVLRRHRRVTRSEARERAVYLLGKVGIAQAADRLGQYPHQLSGGLRQRVMIALALMCDPALIIADEPTTALDVTVQAQILHLLASLQREFGLSLMLITHDLGIVARIADQVAVMYAGEIVEYGLTADIFTNPRHPYTAGLLGCIPIPGVTDRTKPLGSIAGIVPSLIGEQIGCSFAERCTRAQPNCRTQDVPLYGPVGQHVYRCFYPLGLAELPAGHARA